MIQRCVETGKFFRSEEPHIKYNSIRSAQYKIVKVKHKSIQDLEEESKAVKKKVVKKVTKAE